MDDGTRQGIQRVLWHALTHQPEFLLRRPLQTELEPACDYWAMFLLKDSQLVDDGQYGVLMRAHNQYEGRIQGVTMRPQCYMHDRGRGHGLTFHTVTWDWQPDCHTFQLTDLYQQLETHVGRVVAVVYDYVE